MAFVSVSMHGNAVRFQNGWFEGHCACCMNEGSFYTTEAQ